MVYDRPHPVVELGPVDENTALLIVDALSPDLPIVYCSKSFEELTGYQSAEILGRNCRFLQAPNGFVVKGSVRPHVDNQVIYQIRESINNLQECQYININYKKGGEPFVNLISIIPISTNPALKVTHFVGFQVDLMKQSVAILDRLQGLISPTIDSMTSSSGEATPTSETESKPFSEFEFNSELVKLSGDLIYILSSRGMILFASPNASREMLGYSPNEIVGQDLSKICHSGDAINLLRELKQTPISTPVRMSCRFIPKSSSTLWTDIQGHKYQMNNRKKTKCYLLVARPHTVGPLPKSLISQLGMNTGEGLLKVTPEGLVVSSFSADHSNLTGTMLFEHVSPDQQDLVKSTLLNSVEHAEPTHIQLTMSLEAPTEMNLFCFRSLSDELYVALSPNSSSNDTSPNHSNDQSANSPHSNDNVLDCINVNQSTSLLHEINTIKAENTKLAMALEDL